MTSDDEAQRMSDIEIETLAIRLLLPLIAARALGSKDALFELRKVMDASASRVYHGIDAKHIKAEAVRLHSKFDELFDATAAEITKLEAEDAQRGRDRAGSCRPNR